MLTLTRNKQGFSILELVIVFCVLGGLAAIAYPAYLNVVKRQYYAKIIEKTQPYKDAVAKCYALKNKFAGCDAGRNKIPAAISKPTDNITSLTVKDGVISIVPVAGNGVTVTDNYILTPAYKDQNVVWTTSGVAVQNKVAD